MTSLLILIALGYTLLQSKIGDLDLVIPVALMISIMHVMVVGFGKIRDDASYKFHENEGVVGWVLTICLLIGKPIYKLVNPEFTVSLHQL